MSYLSYLNLFCFTIYTYLAAFIFLRNPEERLNRLCAATLACFSVWSFGVVFVHNTHIPKSAAFIFMCVASLGWVSVTSVFLLFILVFTEKKKVLAQKYIYPVLFAIPAFFIYEQCAGNLINDFVTQKYWQKGIWSGTVWPELFFAYYVVFMSLGMMILAHYWISSRDKVKKKQAKIIFLSVSVAFPLITLTDMVLTGLGIHSIPNLGSVSALLWASGVAYAMARYDFLVITPAIAADRILENMAEFVILLNREGCINFVNRKIVETLGYSRNDLLGKTLEWLFPEDVKETQGELLSGEKNIRGADVVFGSKSGETRPVIFSSTVIEGAAGETLGTVCLAVDISDRKHTERALLREKIFTEHIINSIPGILAVYDAKGAGVMFNDNIARITGCSAEELSRKRPVDLFPEEEKEKVSAAFSEAAEKGETTIEADLLVKGGKRVPYYISGRRAKIGDSVYIIGIGIDITERRKAQEELENAAREWTKTFDAMTDMAFIQNADYTITKVNKAFAEAVKKRPEEIVGRKCYEIMHDQDFPWRQCPFEITRSDSKAHTQKVYDPNIGVPLLVTSSPVFDEKGNIVAAVHIAKDISEIEKTEKELKRKIKDLELFHKIVVGREIKMLELKKKITELQKQLKEKYKE